MSTSSNILQSRMFQELTFYYDPDELDFLVLNSKIVAHGGHLTGFAHIAGMKLARVPYFEGGDFYDAVYIDDCIAAGKLLDKDEYYISRLIGVAFVDSTLSYSERRLLNADRARAGLEPRRTPRGSIASRDRSRSRSRSPEQFNRRMSVVSPTGTARPFRENPINRLADPFIMRGREFYSKDDDMRILDYIHESYEIGGGRVKYNPNGNQFWIEAQHRNLIPGRSDQSMRGRYLKTIRAQYQERLMEYVRWKEQGNSWRNPY